jgi:predicted TIM-barrel fold metal-dependent hydrolase
MVPLAKALVAANPTRILWGSDWPHPNTSPDAPRTAAGTAPRIDVDEVRIFHRVADWAPDAALRKLVLVDNPAGLYGW